MKTILEFLVTNNVVNDHLLDMKKLMCKYFGEATKKFTRGKDLFMSYNNVPNKRFTLSGNITAEIVKQFGEELQDICEVSPDVRNFPGGEIMANYRITAWPDDEGNAPFICIRLNSRGGNTIDMPGVFVPEKNLCK